MFLRSQHAFVFRGAGGWCELSSGVSCVLDEMLHDAIATMVAPRANVGVFFKSQDLKIDGVPVEYSIRLTTERTIHLTSVIFPSGENAEIRFGARPTGDGYWCMLENNSSSDDE